ncbi:MAG: M28 family metallopeptidase [Actinomycetota bacterium]
MRAVRVLLLGVLLAACTSPGGETRRTTSPSPSPSSSLSSQFVVQNVVEVVRVLAGTIGPRETTSPTFRRAGAYVERLFRALGYGVTRQAFTVPAGLANLVAVPDGATFNVVAEPPGFDPLRPHLIVGAHLDTVPQAPGAVDNATGVGIVIELARLAALQPPSTSILFVAFGGEEARVPRGGLHGSKFFSASLDARERAAVNGVIVIDRVGTGSRVPICTVTDAPDTLARTLLNEAREIGVPAFACDNESSDHVSFVRVGITAVRIGPDDYPQYHTTRDVPSVLVPAQAARVGTLLWEALR